MDEWIGKAIGKMRINKIKSIDVANYMGITAQYLSEIFNGKKNPKSAEERIMSAIDEIISKRSIENGKARETKTNN